MKKIRIILIVVIICFSGCVTQPDLPKYTIGKKDKIGYIIDVSNKVEHSHIGTTIFSNFEKTYDYNLGIEDNLKTLLTETVSSELINLSELGYESKDVIDLIIAKDKDWVVNKPRVYERFIKELKLKAIIIIKDKFNSLYWYPKLMEIKGTGIISKSNFGFKTYIAFLGAQSSIYLLEPIGKIIVNESPYFSIIYDSIIGSAEERSGFRLPVDMENITLSEMKPVFDVNRQMLEVLIKETNTYIKNKRKDK